MPQELQVVRCFACETFQVDIVKKIPKWACKMCGEKQSVKKIYGRGSGSDCRLIVQTLNQQRITLQHQFTANTDATEEFESDTNYAAKQTHDESNNKWLEFTTDVTSNETEEPSNFTFERPTKKRCKVNKDLRLSRRPAATEDVNSITQECEAENCSKATLDTNFAKSKWTDYCFEEPDLTQSTGTVEEGEEPNIKSRGNRVDAKRVEDCSESLDEETKWSSQMGSNPPGGVDLPQVDDEFRNVVRRRGTNIFMDEELDLDSLLQF